jgi:hypothetical protein
MYFATPPLYCGAAGLKLYLDLPLHSFSKKRFRDKDQAHRYDIFNLLYPAARSRIWPRQPYRYL